MATSPLAQTLTAALQNYPQLDPRAVMAVASQEGMSGGIGDNGHAFGPFQLNNAGGVITGRFAGQTPQQINQWAWSPAGINYALGRIASVANGLHGQAAVSNIVSRFERPANIPREIAGASAAYGGLPAYTPALQSPVAPALTQTAQTVTPAPVASPLAAQLPGRPRADGSINALLAIAAGNTPTFSNILASIR